MVYAAAHTKVPVSDNFSEDRQVQICRFLYRNSVHVMGLQEAHIKDDQCLEQLTNRFKDWEFVLLSNLQPEPQRQRGICTDFSQHLDTPEFVCH